MPKNVECPKCGEKFAPGRINQHRAIMHGWKPPHGTKGRYDHHQCRCTRCRKANSDYMKAYYKKHGRPSRAKKG